MIRITSATYSATCPACRDKSALNLTAPCSQHLAAAQGLRVNWLPVVVAAWSAATVAAAAKQPNPVAALTGVREVIATDLWKPFR